MKLIVISLTLAVFVIAAVLFSRMRKGTNSPELDAAKGELRTAKGALKTAQRTRDEAVNKAAGAVKTALKQHGKRVTTAQKTLNLLTDSKGRSLGRYHGITLYERWIATPHGEGPLAGTTASVDAQVSSRITATRLLAIGVFALAAKKKTGAVYLSIDNSHLASVVECPQNENGAARQFAVKIVNAAREAERVAELLPAQITAAEQQLSTEVSDTAVIDTAEAHLATVEADPGLRGSVQAGTEAVAEAEQRIVQLSAPTPQDSVARPTP